MSTAKLRTRRKQQGYILLILMLVIALLMIAMAAAVPEIAQEIRRDREEELRHRGTAYMRAIQSFHRRLGRYPTRLEELESSNNIRFIRKLYKDPMTKDPATGQEKDFKILRQMDLGANSGPAVAQTPGQSAFAGQGSLQRTGGLDSSQVEPSGLEQTSEQSPSSDSKPAGNLNSPGSPSSDSNSDSASPGPTFGGGPILGVVSTSKKKSIREFYGKNRYDGWLFVYLQERDLGGGLLKGPVNPGAPIPFGGQGAPGLPGQGTGIAGQTSTSQMQSLTISGAPSPNE